MPICYDSMLGKDWEVTTVYISTTLVMGVVMAMSEWWRREDVLSGTNALVQYDTNAWCR